MAPVLVILLDSVTNKQVVSPLGDKYTTKNLTRTGKYGSDGLYGRALKSPAYQIPYVTGCTMQLVVACNFAKVRRVRILQNWCPLLVTGCFK